MDFAKLPVISVPIVNPMHRESDVFEPDLDGCFEQHDVVLRNRDPIPVVLDQSCGREFVCVISMVTNTCFTDSEGRRSPGCSAQRRVCSLPLPMPNHGL